MQNMKIKNLDQLNGSQIEHELRNGAKFVVFEYCVSIIFLTLKRNSGVYFVRSTDSRIKSALPYLLVSLLFGWWGFPWGPIYTIGSVITDIRGGKDVTAEILESLAKNSEPPPASPQ